MTTEQNSSGNAESAIERRTEQESEPQPTGVSDRMWQKFQALKKRRQDVSRRSAQKRVKQLQDNILQKVEEEFVQPEDLDVLLKQDVALPGISKTTLSDSSDITDDSGGTYVQKSHIDEAPSHDTNTEVNNTKTDWQSVKSYLNCNDHLKGVDRGKYAPKTKLHEDIDEAIAKEDYKKAEELSDKLATREFGKNIAEAFDAKRYAEKRKKEEEIANAKRKKKLNWGFEHKQRWETKSNM